MQPSGQAPTVAVDPFGDRDGLYEAPDAPEIKPSDKELTKGELPFSKDRGDLYEAPKAFEL